KWDSLRSYILRYYMVDSTLEQNPCLKTTKKITKVTYIRYFNIMLLDISISGEIMEKEWQIDLSLPDIGALMTLLSTAVSSALMGVGSVLYVVMMMTTAYEVKGKDFLISLMNPEANLTFEADFVLVVGTLLIISAIFFFITMITSIFELNAVSKKDRNGRINIVFTLFGISMISLISALLSTVLLRYYYYY
ncbi:MAG: hypothetical protein U9P81_03490, partial [Euryarchaeota archaeon]|nr:hypothetical protein [Euryarchaeota archaeon]